MSRIPGFRSGKRWKKIVASIGYIVIILLALFIWIGISANSGSGKKVSTTSASSEKSANPLSRIDTATLKLTYSQLQAVQSEWGLELSGYQNWINGKGDPSNIYVPLLELDTDAGVAKDNLTYGVTTDNQKAAVKPIITTLTSLVATNKKLQQDILTPHPGVELSKSPQGAAINDDIKALMLDVGSLSAYDLKIAVAIQSTQ